MLLWDVFKLWHITQPVHETAASCRVEVLTNLYMNCAQNLSKNALFIIIHTWNFRVELFKPRISQLSQNAIRKSHNYLISSTFVKKRCIFISFNLHICNDMIPRCSAVFCTWHTWQLYGKHKYSFSKQYFL